MLKLDRKLVYTRRILESGNILNLVFNSGKDDLANERIDFARVVSENHKQSDIQDMLVTYVTTTESGVTTIHLCSTSRR